MPLIIPLIIYLVILLVFIIFSFFIIFHLLNFGFLGDATKAMILLYVLLSLVVLVPTFIYILSVPWFSATLTTGSITFPLFLFGN